MSKKFRVWAKMDDYLYLDVEAESKEEAVAIAEEADGGDFTSEGALGDWEIKEAVEIDEEGNKIQ